MTQEPSNSAFSRRAFLGASTAVAGVMSVGRWLTTPTAAAEPAAVMKRAGFAAHHLWVTPYEPAERYPAGEYPNQHPTGDGLARWTAANRNVTDTPLVVWYVFSHNHVPRPEDWPVMPVSSLGFWLKPDGFFEQNPAIDLPPTSPT